MTLLERLCRTPDDRWPIVPRLLAGVPLLFFGVMHWQDPEHFRAILTHAGFPFVEFQMVTAFTLEVMGGLMLILGLAGRLGGLFGVMTMMPAIVTTLRFHGDPTAPLIPPLIVPVVAFLASAVVLTWSSGRYSIDYAILPKPPVWPTDGQPLASGPAKIPEVVIIGGGFGGLFAAQGLRFAPLLVTLVDRRNFHLFQPLLYQVATGGLSPANIAAPLRGILKKQKNTRVLLAEVRDIDPKARTIHLTDGQLNYDYLIVAAGASHAYFGHPEWEDRAPGLKTIEDATEIRRRVLWAFEMAERSLDPVLCACWQTFVVVGAGPTGVEMAGAISELARHTLVGNFRRIDPAATRVILLEGGPRVLPTFHESLSAKALTALQRMGVEVRLNTMVTDVQAHGVTVKTGDRTEFLAASTVIWGAGVQASPLAAILARATGATQDRAGRIAVLPDLTLPKHPDIFVVGDMALSLAHNGRPVPGVAPAAMQMGAYAANAIMARLEGRAVPPFRYWDKGSMATIGRAAAVAESKGLRLSGYPAWLAWLFIHILFLVQFENRVLVMWQWFWNYLTRNRTARLITGTPPNDSINSFAEGVKEVMPVRGEPTERERSVVSGP